MDFLPHAIKPPLIYDLGWTGQGIRIETSASNLRRIIDYCHPDETEFLRKDLGLKEFLPADQESWGFGGTLRHTVPEYKNGMAWECKLPKAEKNADEVFNHAASLDLLFRALNGAKHCLDAGGRQLIVVFGMRPTKGMSGGQINLVVMPDMIDWLGKQTEKSLAGVSEAVHEAQDQMENLSQSFGPGSFEIAIREHWFFLKGPIAGLYPDFEIASHNGSYQLLSHNSDHPMKQLELLAGVAALNQLACHDTKRP